MIRSHADYEIDDSFARHDFTTVHRWLSETYWWQSPSLPREKLERGARHSALTIGVYHGNQQVGFARVVSDTIRFGWIADVYVAPAHRKQGLARAMVRFALDHPQLKEVNKWLLATKDAHGVYAALGFTPPPDADAYLQLWRDPPPPPPSQTHSSPGTPGEAG
jgi:GNAT superfamily N-acetyltransferase